LYLLCTLLPHGFRMLARTQTRFHEIRLRLEKYTPRTAAGRFLWEVFLFGFKEGWACLFGGILLGLLLLTRWGGRPARRSRATISCS
jgi:hypothetical protein